MPRLRSWRCGPRRPTADAVLVVTPEYNGSIPAVLKNAIDWLSRPYGNGALKDKPLAVIGSALGQYGGVWAHDETRKSFGIAGRAGDRGHHAVGAESGTFDGKHPRENAELVARTSASRSEKLVAEVELIRSCAEAVGGSLLTCRRLCCMPEPRSGARGSVGGRW